MDDALELCPKCAVEAEQPTPEEPVHEAPAADDAAEVSTPEQTEGATVSVAADTGCGYSETVLPPKKNARKIVLIAVAALLIIGAIVACILIFCKPDPETAVKDAYAKTCDEFDGVFANAPDLADAIDIASDILAGDKMNIGLDIGAALSTDMEQFARSQALDINLSIDMDLDAKEQISCGEYSVSVGLPGAATELDFLLSTNKDSIIMQMPDYIDGSYGVAFTDDFVDRLLNSCIYNESSLSEELPPFAVRMYAAALLSGLNSESDDPGEDATAPIANAYNDLKKTFEYEESDVEIPKCGSLDMYRISYDKEAYEAFVGLLADLFEEGSYSTGLLDLSFTEMPDEMLDTLRNSKVKIYVGIDENDRLAAVSLCLDGSHLTLRLSGKDNVWSSFALYIDKATVLNGGFKSTKSGFELRLSGKDEGGIVVACNDKSGKLTFKVIEDGGMTEVKLAFNYELIRNRTGVKFALDLSELVGSDVSISLSLKPLKDEVTMLDTEFVDVLDFTEEEYHSFILAVLDGMYGGMLSESLGDDFTYENIFGSSDIEYYDDAA